MKRLIALTCSLMIFALTALTQTRIITVRAQYTESELTAAITSASDWMRQNGDPLSAIGEKASDVAVTAFKRAGLDYDYDAYLNGLDTVAQNYNETSDAAAMQLSLMAVDALGGDPGYFGGRDFAGDSTYWRPLNSAAEYIGALTALDAGQIEIPIDAPVDRDDYVATVLAYQLPDGSFGDIKTTADAVTALAGDYNDVGHVVTYPDDRGQTQVTGTEAISKALLYLSSRQNDDGDFDCLTDTAAVSMAMDAMGIGQADTRFVKNNNTVMDGLLKFRKDNGGFSEDYNDADANATAYALSAMVSNARALQNKAEYYDFGSDDTITVSNNTQNQSSTSSGSTSSGSTSSGSTSSGSTSSGSTSSGSTSSGSTSSGTISSGSTSSGTTSSGSTSSGSTSSSGSSLFGGSLSRTTPRPSATTRPNTSATTRPRISSTTRPYPTIAPSSSSSPTPRPTPSPSPLPTQEPNLVGPVRIVGPMPSFSPEPEIDYDAETISYNDGDDNGIEAAAIIMGVLTLAVLVLVIMAKNKLWVFKMKPEKKEYYKAKIHRRTEIHRRYEDRRKTEKRGKYSERRKYKAGHR